MHTNLKVVLFSVLASIIPIAYALIILASFDGLDELGALNALPIIVGISLCFGIAGFILNKGERFFRALFWFIISLAVMLSLATLFLHRDLPLRNMILDESHQQSQLQNNYVGQIT